MAFAPGEHVLLNIGAPGAEIVCVVRKPLQPVNIARDGEPELFVSMIGLSNGVWALPEQLRSTRRKAERGVETLPLFGDAVRG